MKIAPKIRAASVIVLLVGAGFAPPAATAVGSSAVVGDLSPTTNPARFTFPVTISGFSVGTDFNVVISASDGDLDLPTTTGLTAMVGYPSVTGDEAEFGFAGDIDDITTALSEVGFTPDAPADPGTISVVLSESAGENFFYFPENGHYYEAVSLVVLDEAIPSPQNIIDPSGYDTDLDGEFSWSEARNGAASRTLFGLTGYLVTVTSEEENSFVANKTDASEIWIGAGRRDTTTFDLTSDNPGLVFEWKTGPEAGTAFAKQTDATSGGYTAVGGAFNAWEQQIDTEPNNYQYDEDPGWVENYVTTNWNGTRGRWNDLPNASLWSGGVVRSFLVEYGGTGEFAHEFAETQRNLGSDGGGSEENGGGLLADTGSPTELLAWGLPLGVAGMITGAALLLHRRRNRSTS